MEESLFDGLLNPREDSGSTKLENYFTKIVAHLFKTSPEILYTWLEQVGVLENTSQYTKAPEISPQKPYGRLSHHSHDSIIDIEIKLFSNTYRDLIFIESKIDSKEQGDQLRRYAELLHAQSGVRNKILLYVTHNHDPKNKAKILEGIPTVHFEQVRWYTLQEVLQSQAKNALFDEIIVFMYEIKRGQNKKLRRAGVSQKLTRAEVADLSGANLTGADLSNKNLSKFNLRGVNLSGANLSGADLSGADLRESNLQRAILSGTNLNGANLCGVNLQGASLDRANLYNADLRRVNLTDITYNNEPIWPKGFNPR